MNARFGVVAVWMLERVFIPAEEPGGWTMEIMKDVREPVSNQQLADRIWKETQG